MRFNVWLIISSLIGIILKAEFLWQRRPVCVCGCGLWKAVCRFDASGTSSPGSRPSFKASKQRKVLFVFSSPFLEKLNQRKRKKELLLNSFWTHLLINIDDVVRIHYSTPGLQIILYFFELLLSLSLKQKNMTLASCPIQFLWASADVFGFSRITDCTYKTTSHTWVYTCCYSSLQLSFMAVTLLGFFLIYFFMFII